jgi:hypothetical protein
MSKPSSKTQEVLKKSLLKIAERPDLTHADAQWLNRFVLRIIAELSVVKSKDEKIAA